MTAQASGEEPKIYIEEMASLLDPPRAVHTLRQWLRERALPKDLQPQREGGRQKIFWTRPQVDGLKAWAIKRASRRGWQGGG